MKIKFSNIFQLLLPKPKQKISSSIWNLVQKHSLNLSNKNYNNFCSKILAIDASKAHIYVFGKKICLRYINFFKHSSQELLQIISAFKIFQNDN